MSSALAAYEYLACLPDEVLFLWQTKCSAATVFAIMNRYTLLVYVALNSVIVLEHTVNPVCRFAVGFGMSLTESDIEVSKSAHPR